ncbi:hypothetical protein MBAV_000343 [Candidatus Magnetobacterium bavaricum]|uniref:Uncharacterized protein n=1 Tax=Candidatus Magnetobacterium bavaricum TaxID=29290 RepID=A0A0F3H3G0_9BACT|nr:hypothetical protein MBAV_000343 [Candidatus Magnetobacterium bavaricum]
MYPVCWPSLPAVYSFPVFPPSIAFFLPPIPLQMPQSFSPILFCPLSSLPLTL